MTDTQASIMSANLALAFAQAHSRAAWKAFNAHASLPHAGFVPSLAKACRVADKEVEEREATLASLHASLKRSSR